MRGGAAESQVDARVVVDEGLTHLVMRLPAGVGAIGPAPAVVVTLCRETSPRISHANKAASSNLNTE